MLKKSDLELNMWQDRDHSKYSEGKEYTVVVFSFFVFSKLVTRVVVTFLPLQELTWFRTRRETVADSRPRVDPANMARMDQAADFAVDGARVSVDDKDGFVGWANQVCAEQAGARDGAIGGAPFGKMAVQRFTNARYDVDFSCFQLNSLLVESTAAAECPTSANLLPSWGRGRHPCRRTLRTGRSCATWSTGGRWRGWRLTSYERQRQISVLALLRKFIWLNEWPVNQVQTHFNYTCGVLDNEGNAGLFAVNCDDDPAVRRDVRLA